MGCFVCVATVTLRSACLMRWVQAEDHAGDGEPQQNSLTTRRPKGRQRRPRRDRGLSRKKPTTGQEPSNHAESIGCEAEAMSPTVDW
jgi:hypothetical protein